MINDIFFIIWFFLPAGIANLSPVLAARIPLISKLNYPLDLNLKINNKPIFGDHKTWRGLVSGIFLAIIVLQIQVLVYDHNHWIRSVMTGVNYNHIPVILLGFLFGIGSLGGDAIESFFKRQLAIDPGKSLFPFDQIDYILGGILSTFFIISLSFWRYFWLIIIWLILHLLFSLFGYFIGLKDSPI